MRTATACMVRMPFFAKPYCRPWRITTLTSIARCTTMTYAKVSGKIKHITTTIEISQSGKSMLSFSHTVTPNRKRGDKAIVAPQYRRRSRRFASGEMAIADLVKIKAEEGAHQAERV